MGRGEVGQRKRSQAHLTGRVFKLDGIALWFYGTREGNPFLRVVFYGLLSAFTSVFLFDLQNTPRRLAGKIELTPFQEEDPEL